MNIRLLRDLPTSLPTWTMCCILISTTFGCAIGTDIPINPSETTDAVSHVYVYRGDQVLIYTKGGPDFHIKITEISRERKTITGRPPSISGDSDYEPIVVHFSDIKSIKFTGESYYWHEVNAFGHRDNWFLAVLGIVILGAL